MANAVIDFMDMLKLIYACRDTNKVKLWKFSYFLAIKEGFMFNNKELSQNFLEALRTTLMTEGLNPRDTLNWHMVQLSFYIKALVLKSMKRRKTDRGSKKQLL